MLTIGDKFPAFKAQACVSIEKGQEFAEITDKSYDGKWLVAFFYPKDFTFICPTELAEFSNRVGDFADRDAQVIGGSTDNEFSHLAWRKDHEDLKGLKYPLIAANKLAAELGILDKDEGVCLRATFLVDPNGIIRWVYCNDLSVGRSVDETIRVLDALQTDELCPCNWKAGEDTIKVD